MMCTASVLKPVMLNYNVGMKIGLINRHWYVRSVWIACVAIFLNALLPSLDYAVSKSISPQQVVEICSAVGTKFLPAAQVLLSDSSPDTKHHQFKQCSFCATHAGTFALPVDLAVQWVMPVGHTLIPFLFYRSPKLLFSWLHAHPRAPPAIS